MIETPYAQSITDSILLVVEEIGSVNRRQIAELIPTSVSYISTVLNRALQKGTVEKSIDPDDRRVSIWDFVGKKFRNFIFTLRVIETSSTAKRKNEWGGSLDVEASISGTVAGNKTEDQIKNMFKKELKEQMLMILSEQNPPVLTIPEDRIKVDVKETASGISGVELGDFTDEMENDNKIDILFTNNIGKRYAYDKNINTRIDQF